MDEAHTSAEHNADRPSDSRPPAHHRLSYSQITQFEKCPLSYRYRYVDRLPTKPSPHLSFGITLHSALEQFYRQHIYERPREAQVAWVRDYVLENWHEDGFVNASHEEIEEWQRKGIEALDRFLRDDDVALNTPIALEEWFEIPFDNSTERFILVGKIDRIDVVGPGPDTLRVIDYKTNKDVPPQWRLQQDRQLAIYHLACERDALDKVDLPRLPITVTFYYLMPGQSVSFQLDRDALTKTERYVIDAYRAIGEALDSGRFEPTPGPLCPYCDYYELCPLFGGKEVAAAEHAPEGSLESLDLLIEEFLAVGQEVSALLRKRDELKEALARALEERGLTEHSVGPFVVRLVEPGNVRVERLPQSDARGKTRT